jgi:hypothetical protein
VAFHLDAYIAGDGTVRRMTEHTHILGMQLAILANVHPLDAVPVVKPPPRSDVLRIGSLSELQSLFGRSA